MDGIHDLGGKEGFGSVERDMPESVFHARWEAKVFNMMLAATRAGAWLNTDEFRHLIERIDPKAYLSDGYYGRWLGAIETGLVERNIIQQDEINQRYVKLGGLAEDKIAARPDPKRVPIGERPSALGSKRETSAPLFEVGDCVYTAVDINPGHTRLPAYARGKAGIVRQLQGGWIYPDTNAHGLGEAPQNLYTIEFDASTLWSDGDLNVTVHLDLFEAYLSPHQAR